MSKRSFVSRRHKSRGDPRSRTGLQCGQVVVREGAQRPGIKVYIYIYVCFMYDIVHVLSVQVQSKYKIIPGMRYYAAD